MRCINVKIVILILILFNSCKNLTSNTKQTDVENAHMNGHEFYTLECKKQTIKGIEYEACIKRPGSFRVVKSDGEIVYSREDNPFDFEFSDFNGDGYPDIRMNYVSNIPGLYKLLLFDVKSDEFQEVKLFDQYPNSKRIGDSDFYYSYHGNGCAGNDWGSELFKIIDAEIYVFGKIKGLGCLDNEENGVYIYKVNGSENELLKYIRREQGHWADKWTFIETYWIENKNEFE